MSDVSPDIDAAAASWDARLRSGRPTPQDQRAFQAWLQSDARHQITHDQLQASLRTLRSHADLPELSALRDEARNFVQKSQRRRIMTRVSAGIGMAAAGLLFFVMPQADNSAINLRPLVAEVTYTTANDEHSKVTLADGSVVTLDSDSRMAVRLSAARRDISLLSGRALFKVAKDNSRPFVVKAGSRTITALGTLFDVRVTPREMRVTLAEGSVSVKPVAAGRKARPQILKPRQQLVVVTGAPNASLRTVDIDNALAWVDRQFFFEDEPLASAVDEMNRYADRKIVVDPAVADLRISGMFRVNNQAGFIEALKMTLPVAIHPDAKGRLVVSRRAGGKGADV